jgi:hypothetical protein
LASADLALPDNLIDPEGSTLPEMQLLKEIRRDPHCGIVILSGHQTAARVRAALRSYKVNDFLDKLKFKEDEYVEAAKSAIRECLLARAAERDAAGQLLTVTFDARAVINVELGGLGPRFSHRVERPLPIDFADFASRADGLNRSVATSDAEGWRDEARSIGKSLYKALLDQPEVNEVLKTARALAGRERSGLSLQFNGPPEGLSFPFELMTDGEEYLVLDHPVSRRVDNAGPAPPSGPFHKFVRSLAERSEAMRVLVVGLDSDGAIPGAEEEATSMAAYLESRLRLLGIDPEVLSLTGAEATTARVKEELRGGYHLFHYSGHADYDGELPERSPITLSDGVLTASDLKLLVSETGLRLMFLSCCLGGRAGAGAGRGEFHSFPHALRQAGVPVSVGHRWVVTDDSARLIAEHFYSVLFSDFCPRRALLKARKHCAIESAERRDAAAWASPILLMDA